MVKYIIVNEATLASFMWSCWRGQKPYVLGILPVLSFFNGTFSRLANRALTRGAARDAFDKAPSLAHIRTFSVTVMIHDVFAATEPWQRETFRFADADRELPDYATAYKLIAANYVSEIQVPMLLVDAISRAETPGGHRLLGVSPALRSLFESFFRHPFPAARARVAGVRMLNVVLAAAAAGLAVGWIATRTRLRTGTDTSCFLAVDDLGDGTNIHLLNAVADGGEIVLAGRLKNTPPPVGLRATYRQVWARDGRLGIGDSVRATGLVLRDLIRILRHCKNIEPQVFWRTAQLPLRRIMIRALLGRIRPRYFWGRDPYSPDHSLRRQEMHRIGGESHGLLHGFGALTDLYPMFRYVDYDRFYVFGRDIARLYRDSWVRDMDVVAAGTFGFSTDEIARIRAAAGRRRDIVVFTNILAILNDHRFVAMIRALGVALPDRTILLQTKSTVRRAPSTLCFLEACTKNLANVVVTEEPLAALMERAACAISDPSTVVMEAIQLGIPAFAADLLDGQKTCLYRAYPWLCLRKPDEAVERIGALLAGDWNFPFADCANLVNITETTIFDHFREGLGLPLRERVNAPENVYSR